MFLYQDEGGFLFNSDSHFLYDFISCFNPKGEVLDVGCGCGILGLLVARDFDIRLHSIDLQEQNIFLTKTNARVNRVVTTTHTGDFLEYEFENRFDLIISNPPYYHDGVTRSDNSSLKISRYSHHLPLNEMIKKANSIIKPKGSFIFCYDAKQLQDILGLLDRYKFRATDIRFVQGTKNKSSSLVMIRAKKSSNSLTTIHPPLIHFKDEEMSQEAKNIYQKTRTYSIKCKIL